MILPITLVVAGGLGCRESQAEPVEFPVLLRQRLARFADFHGLRHLFISNLERAGVTPKMAQTLARHRDIRLTQGVYTHMELDDQTAALEALRAPPSVKTGRR